MQAFKNRNIFECWMAMRLGIVKGALLLVAPLYSASFGPFLAETRKVHQLDKLKFVALWKQFFQGAEGIAHFLPAGQQFVQNLRIGF